MALSAAAGPLTNMVLALLSVLALKFIIVPLAEVSPVTGQKLFSFHSG
jgi:membrane-associated protease RseP (regulator of RpoE activity)